MEIVINTNPDRQITQTVLYFQFRYIGWTSQDMITQDDRYGSLPFGYVLGYIGTNLVGVINLLKRTIIYHKKQLLLGGFGGVCTHKEYQRQGIATTLLRSGMDCLKKEMCDVAFLCTDLDTLAPLYEQVGFAPLRRPYTATGKSGTIYEDSGGMIAPICSQDIFQQILQDKSSFDIQGQDW